jgi:hypothetical protein
MQEDSSVKQRYTKVQPEDNEAKELIGLVYFLLFSHINNSKKNDSIIVLF